jgi:predicted amidohydrolase/GNAT superfamily N-acetyltransferase
MEKLDRIRVASLQYFIRPVNSFDQFQEQVAGLVETAADYKCHLVVFPEYFTTQLLMLGNYKRPIKEQVRDLSKQAPRFVSFMTDMAVSHKLYIVGGSIPVEDSKTGRIRNRCYFFSPDGDVGFQDKLHMTRFEKEEWIIESGSRLKIFETDFGKVAINICYDVEFPEIARTAARAGATVLIVPSCTDDRQGFLRVRYCAHARAVENQMFVIHSSTVGSLPMVPAVSLNYGQASILTPSDFAFSRDGILSEGIPNQETMVIGELNLKLIAEHRNSGTVLPLLDSQKTSELLTDVDLVSVTPANERYLVRKTEPKDFEKIIALCEAVYPDSPSWSKVQLQSHRSVFAEGQMVVEEQATGKVVGFAASLIIYRNDYDWGTPWRIFTNNGMFTNHDPEKGKTLYGAEIMVHPDFQGTGVGTELYRARENLAKSLGLKRICAGARLRGYHQHNSTLSAEDYVRAVEQKKIWDPTLSFQLNRGFRVVRVVSEYLKFDPESLGYAAIIEWQNSEIISQDPV